MVLPEGEGEGDPERDDADNQPGAKLVEVLDEAQSVVMTDRPQRGGHRRRELGPALAGGLTVGDGRRGLRPGLGIRVGHRRRRGVDAGPILVVG